MPDKPRTDWEAIEREYRAGQLSIREIAKKHGISDTAIRKEAKARGWERALADKVQKAVREKLVRSDGSQSGSQEQRANDKEIIEGAAVRGFEVVQSHRRDIQQLTAISSILATRLAAVINGDPHEGPCLGDKESPGDLLEKLTRVRGRLIPLERQAYNLDQPERDPSDTDAHDGSALDLLARRLDRIASRGGPGEGSGGANEEAG
ncbi:hypothetical protein ABLE91_05700 [Aquabacter sp. CN5-332]|uniref:hypothetical protein n=1 Tax=Aquabacter sp. CN5-332 TaxID=3156608 RepID=UPI0032B47E59